MIDVLIVIFVVCLLLIVLLGTVVALCAARKALRSGREVRR